MLSPASVWRSGLTESDRLDGKVNLWGREASWSTNWRWMLTAEMGRSRRLQDGKGKFDSRGGSAEVRRELNTRCVGRVSVSSIGLEKVRMSARECSLLPASGGRSRLTVLDR